MPYKYIAFTSAGELSEGVLDVESEQAAEEQLWRSDMTIMELKRQGKPLSLEEALPSLYAVRKRDVIVFSRQLSTLLTSGIAALPAIRLLKEESTKKLFAKVLDQVLEDIQMGNSLSESFAKHKQIFPPIYVRLIEVGEQTGKLEDVLRRLADYMEKEEGLVRKVRSALIYPSVIIALSMVVALLFVNFVLPGMTGLFTEFKAELPLPTRILLGGSKFIQTNFLLIVLFLVALGAGGYWYKRTPQGKKQIDYALMTRIPFIKSVILKGSMARIASILAMLLAAGLPLTETMELLLRTAQNQALADALDKMRGDVLGGMAMSEALGRQPVFPAMLGQMVKVGEETGALAENLETLARFYEEETDRAVTAVTSMIEPVLIICIGGFIAFLAVSIVTPMYSIMKVIR